jgi:hypothetical protein
MMCAVEFLDRVRPDIPILPIPIRGCPSHPPERCGVWICGASVGIGIKDKRIGNEGFYYHRARPDIYSTSGSIVSMSESVPPWGFFYIPTLDLTPACAERREGGRHNGVRLGCDRAGTDRYNPIIFTCQTCVRMHPRSGRY